MNKAKRKPRQFGAGVVWEQGLVDAEVSVARASFEMNGPGDVPPRAMNKSYILECMEDAIECLRFAKAQLKKRIERDACG